MVPLPQLPLQDADPNAGGQPTSGGLGQGVETLEGVRPPRGLAMNQKRGPVSRAVVDLAWLDVRKYHEIPAFASMDSDDHQYMCSAAVF